MWEQAGGEHPITRAVTMIEAALDLAAGADAMYLSAAAQREALLGLTRLVDGVESLRMRVMQTVGAPGGVAATDGARSVAGWLDARARTGYGAGRSAERLGEALASRWRLVAAGLEAGAVNLPQARVIVKALDNLVVDPLPGEEVPAEVLARAEAHLVEQAARFNPKQLETLGAKILQTVAPETCEEHERKLLERAERRANAATRLTIRRRGDGASTLSGTIPDHAAARLKTYLQAWTSPKQDDGKTTGAATSLGAFAHLDPATGERLPQERLLGLAFCAFLEAADPARIPAHGGGATKVLVTINYEDLLDKLAHGHCPCTTEGKGKGQGKGKGSGKGRGRGKRSGWILTNGEDLTEVTAHNVHRMACQAEIIPVVLDGDGVPLAMGRKSRFFQTWQREAHMLRHHTCQTVGCSIPAQWCEAHHGGPNPWAGGGNTDLNELVLLCPFHHHKAHDPGYASEKHAGGDVRYHRRT
ncbi:HNH endonuclease signature motif containing protein [Nocardioides solisilvae]|uniref:HNH endonuclease signature motif containing protein n=1 Tax=Nocardioides solisilvae TaxID=1542435 RepID=UPI000D7407EC|nr:HNH endonuclease signature motif containing protein [Nocardioides solisilvae]